MKATPGEPALSKKGAAEGFFPGSFLLYRRISITEVASATAGNSMNKAAGPDLFRVVRLQMSRSISRGISAICRRCDRYEVHTEIPRKICQSTSKQFGASPKRCSDRRPISPSSPTTKLLELTIARRVAPISQDSLLENRYAYRRACNAGIFCGGPGISSAGGHSLATSLSMRV